MVTHPAMKLRTLLTCSVALVLAVVGCSDPSSSSDASPIFRIASNSLNPRIVLANHGAANTLAEHRVTGERLGAHRFSVSPAASELLATEDGRQLFVVLVACALSDRTTIVATVDGTELEFFGEVGIAPHWLTNPLGQQGQEWVSACVLAKLNGHDVVNIISMRGTHSALATSPEERTTWSLEEGAFFGDVFAPQDKPIQWLACRGKGQVSDPSAGGLIDRVCAKEDSANPGKTECGLTYAGSCDYVCAQGYGFYAECKILGRVFPTITTFLEK